MQNNAGFLFLVLLGLGLTWLWWLSQRALRYPGLEPMVDSLWKSIQKGTLPTGDAGPNALVLPQQIWSQIARLCDADVEHSGPIHMVHTNGGVMMAEGFEEKVGSALTSAVPDTPYNFHTHARPAYLHSDVNFPSPHDLLGVLALSMPDRHNHASFVFAREGVYLLSVPRNGRLVHAMLKCTDWKDVNDKCNLLATVIQKAVDRYTASSAVPDYCRAVRAMGFVVEFRPYGTGPITIGLRSS